MAKDVNIHIKAQGTDETKQKLDGVGKSAEKLGQKVASGQKQAAAATQKATTATQKATEETDKLSGSTKKSSGVFGKFISGLKSWAIGLVGVTAIIAGITKAIGLQSRAMEEHADIAEKQQKKLLRLQFLGGFYKERPELRKEVIALSKYGRRPFEEVADAFYNLRSKSASLTEEQRQSIMKESLELGRTDPDMPLDTLVDMFSLYTKKTKAQDINQVQNVLKQTITEAGGGGADVAKLMPRFLPIGMVGGLSGAEAAGLWAHATTQFEDPSQATTGLIATFLGLQGQTEDGDEESKKQVLKTLTRFGIKPSMGFTQKIQTLSEHFRAGRFGLPEAIQIGGRRGAPVLISLLEDPKAMMDVMGRVVGVNRGDVDITADEIKGLMSTDDFARTEEDIRKSKVELENIKGSDIEALKWRKFLLRYEKYLRKTGASELDIGITMGQLKLYRGLGASADRVFGYSAPKYSNEEKIKIWSEEVGKGWYYKKEESGGTTNAPVINNIHYHNETIYTPITGRDYKNRRDDTNMGEPRANPPN